MTAEYWDEEAKRRYLRDRTRVMDWLYLYMPEVHTKAAEVPIPFEAVAIEEETP